jgi:TetR/AcrR family transcriptional regulator of autoinduction and epiphytic fitness
VAMAQRSFVTDIRALNGLRAKLTRYARHLAETHARQVHVMLALAGAASADADAAAIWRKNLEDRRTGMTMFAADLAATGEVRVSQERAADVLWLAQDIRNYDWLVRERGWPVERFEKWFVDGVAAVLTAPE